MAACCRLQFNYSGSLVLSGSIDATCRLWDIRAGRCLSVKQVWTTSAAGLVGQWFTVALVMYDPCTILAAYTSAALVSV
jgi:WD40 repeat protein